METDDYVSAIQAAKLLNSKPATIHAAIRAGNIPALPNPFNVREWVIAKADVEEYRKTRQVDGQPRVGRPPKQERGLK